MIYISFKLCRPTHKTQTIFNNQPQWPTGSFITISLHYLYKYHLFMYWNDWIISWACCWEGKNILKVFWPLLWSHVCFQSIGKFKPWPKSVPMHTRWYTLDQWLIGFYFQTGIHGVYTQLDTVNVLKRMKLLNKCVTTSSEHLNFKARISDKSFVFKYKPIFIIPNDSLFKAFITFTILQCNRYKKKQFICWLTIAKRKRKWQLASSTARVSIETKCRLQCMVAYRLADKTGSLWYT